MSQLSFHMIIPLALVAALGMAMAIDWQSRRADRDRAGDSAPQA